MPYLTSEEDRKFVRALINLSWRTVLETKYIKWVHVNVVEWYSPSVCRVGPYLHGGQMKMVINSRHCVHFFGGGGAEGLGAYSTPWVEGEHKAHYITRLQILCTCLHSILVFLNVFTFVPMGNRPIVLKQEKYLTFFFDILWKLVDIFPIITSLLNTVVRESIPLFDIPGHQYGPLEAIQKRYSVCMEGGHRVNGVTCGALRGQVCYAKSFK